MKILIADSGSTKTSWIYITDSNEFKWRTDGLNPVFHTRESMTEVIKNGFNKQGLSIPDRVYFYGAGCGLGENAALAQHCLEDVFSGADVSVQHDMLGTARALFGNGSGLCGILGTGSNACYYMDGIIVSNPVSLGYILGDQGSGNHIGKQLVIGRIEGSMPQDLQRLFDTSFPEFNHSYLIDKVYRQPFANRYLASFAPFAAQHLPHPWIQHITGLVFNSFFQHQVLLCKGVPAGTTFSATGSIAHHFVDPLKKACFEAGFNFGSALPDPLEALARYHARESENL